MSGKPSPEGAQKLLELLECREKLLAEVAAAQAKVNALSEATARLGEARDTLGATTREIGRLLDSMDCSSVGNFGFEGRMGWLMGEMRRLILLKANLQVQAQLQRAQSGGDCGEEAELNR